MDDNYIISLHSVIETLLNIYQCTIYDLTDTSALIPDAAFNYKTDMYIKLDTM